MDHHEKFVFLMMDEIHLPYFEYKGGTIVGTARMQPRQHMYLWCNAFLDLKKVFTFLQFIKSMLNSLTLSSRAS